MTDDLLVDGDIVTIAGLYADGSEDRDPGCDVGKPLQHWRVAGSHRNGADVVAWGIQPVFADGKPDPDYYRRRARAMQAPES